jgi:hypothetical protein
VIGKITGVKPEMYNVYKVICEYTQVTPSVLPQADRYELGQHCRKWEQQKQRHKIRNVK